MRWRKRSGGWMTAVRTERSFRSWNEDEQAQQVFHRIVWWLREVMPEDEAREFMMAVVDPDPIIDWDTGAELGDPCPRHPGETLSSFAVPDKRGETHLHCLECL